MRDVNNGWAVRYAHANTASFFFICVYAHIGRGLYYGSYRSPRALPWSIGVIILVLMMAKFWPNCQYDESFCFLSSMLPMNKARTKAIFRIGPHNKETLDVIICSMLGDFWADSIPGKNINSIRFQIEQGLNNTAYIHFLTLYFYNLGYCARPVPNLVHKKEAILENRFNYRLTLFTFTSFNWIYDSFYTVVDGRAIKRVPKYIEEFLSPIGLAHWIMQDGSYQKGQGVSIATNSFTYEDCIFLADVISNKFGLKTSVIKTGVPDQWRISIWKRSMPKLAEILKPHIIPEMSYKLQGYL